LVSEGGRLIYATCSILAEENQKQISGFLERHQGFQLLPVRDLWAGVELAGTYDHDFLELTPVDIGSDGFFTAILERRPQV